MKDVINNSEKQILEILENSYTGARMSDDEEMMLRCSRAMFAFKADICKDIFKEEVIESQIEDEINKSIIKTYEKMKCKDLVKNDNGKAYLYQNRCRTCQHNRRCKII